MKNFKTPMNDSELVDIKAIDKICNRIIGDKKYDDWVLEMAVKAI